MRRAAIVFCLLFSGLAALVYQLIWTRLLGFAFGTTTEAIGTVLAVFFGGLAAGNWLAARELWRVERPLRLYGWLELAIGAFALLSLPLLREFDRIYLWVGVDHTPAVMAAIRVLAAAIVLLPPTIAMGATLPVVARALVTSDGSLGRWSAILYTANTLGAVFGAYLCGFWLIPKLGLTRSVLGAAALNLAVAAGVLALAWRTRVAPPMERPAAPGTWRVAASRRTRAAFLAFFAVSGFVAIGYEIVWSRVFGIVMEGTLYGFAAVLSSFLLGIALGSLAIASRVDRIHDAPRAFGLLHVAIAVCVALGLLTIPYLPLLHGWLIALSGGADAVHLLFVLVAPIVLLPTALFGAAFPLLIRIYAGRAASVAEGMGRAIAVNTLGSIAASLLCSFWALPQLGMDATLFALLLLDLTVALLVLLGFQRTRGRSRLTASAGAAVVLLGLSLSFNGVRVEQAIAGREIRTHELKTYARELERSTRSLALVVEGRSSIVTLYEEEWGRMLRSNGLPESLLLHRPPYGSLETVLLGVLPYLFADAPERALVVGLGGGHTVTALRRTDVAAIDVVELERGVVSALARLHAGRENPLDDPRVRLRLNDGRNELLLRRVRGDARYDVIASQPSHPWLQGAANLFTEEFFVLARENLSAGGVFALWVNGFRTDAESLLAIVASFERVFPGAVLVDGARRSSRAALLLLGGHRPLRLDAERMTRRLAAPELADLLGLHGIERLEDLLAQLEGPTAAFAAIRPGAANTDDNAFVETRIPLRLDWSDLDFAALERQLDPTTPVLPPYAGSLDVETIARSLLEVQSEAPGFANKLERLLRAHGAALAPARSALLRAEIDLLRPERVVRAVRELERLAEARPASPEPLRVRARYEARRGQPHAAALAFAAAHARSGDARDAFEAGRALHAIDPTQAWRWFERIPASERVRFPALARYQAERALAEGGELRPAFEALRRYRDTSEGRRTPEVDALLARLAWALGDDAAATAFADAAHRRRLRRAEPLLERASRALAAGDVATASSLVQRIEDLLPGDPRGAELGVRLALAQGDPAAFATALARLRAFAPSLERAVAEENGLRAAQGLPLLPERPAQALVAPAPPPARGAPARR